MKIKKIAAAIMVAGLSSQVSALELGEFNGTTFSVGGYVKAEGVFSMPDDDDNFFEGGARQSRINFSAAKNVDGHQVRGFIESDFWDNNTTNNDSTYAMRLRHAYISVDNLTVGQTWNGQFFATAPFDTEMINLWGVGTGTLAGNGAVIRPDLVLHYSLGGFRFTFQDPVYEDADYPDMVVAYTKRTQGGHAFNLAITGREVETVGDESDFGAAISLASKFRFGNTSFSLSGFTGEGAGIYAGWGYNGAMGPATSDYNPVKDELIRTTGFAVGASHKFNDQWRANIRYGQTKADEVAAGMDEDTLKLALVNLIYTHSTGVDFGIEFRDQNVANRPPSAANTSQRPAGSQVEVMAMYKF
ncbi:porin [Marinobacterium mangrovicola]|uniref:Putative porin n=1 Tax=Marinobacterium mangrovicola TaxID=1476959 RepID=A0A4R1GC48_9GAMM|nr:porin [Marinobacterium mangrovicola]TCK04320.1 putative porin [Marinobacterium mangrovicola]